MEAKPRSRTLKALSPATRGAYSAAAGAALAGVSPGVAGAVVVYSGVQDLGIAQFNAQQLKIDSDAYNDVLLKNYVFPGGNYQGLYVNFAPGKVVGFTSGLRYVSALDADVLIDEAAVTGATGVFEGSMAYGGANPSAQFNNAVGKFIGIAFPIAGVNHYGWLRVTINNAAGTFIINDWAYNNVPGAPIATGELPGSTGVPGDYDNDGLVTAADYAVWRDALGDASTLGGNGDETGPSENLVDEADYTLWVNNYGGPFAEASATPEPVSLGLLACGAAGLGLRRRARRAG